MGGQGSKLSRQKQRQVMARKKAEPTKDYMNTYQKFKANPSFLRELLSQNAIFCTNLVKFFPNAQDSYEMYLEMINYLRKYEPTISNNLKAKNNVPKTTLLDRFFMICLGIDSYQEIQTKTLNLPELQELFKHYMKLFIPNPEGGFIEKLLKYIQLDEENTITIKKFSSEVRQFLPHAQKFLKDYFNEKFRDCLKDAHVLRNFNSEILKEDAVLLTMKLDQMAGKQIVQLYTSETGGLAFHSIQKKLLGYTGHWLLLIEHSEKDSEGEKVTYKFGTFQSGPIREANNFQGSLEGYMFSIEPKIRFMTTDKGDGGSQYFFINNIDEKISKKRRGFGFGGTKHKQNMKLWIDEDIDRSTVYNGNDPTYGYGPLAGLSTDTLSIRKMQIWGLGTRHNLNDQIEYWKQRQQQIMKRRKVNKKELIDGNANLMFEKTFAHRDQVVGEIERKQQDDK